MEIADEHGLGALSMRSLGNALGVEAMSLYNYIAGKKDLLAATLDLVLSDLELPDSSRPWRDELRSLATATHDALLAHPWACELLLLPNEPQIITARLMYIESILACLRHAGFSPSAASRGYHAIDSHTLGFTLWQLGHTIAKDAPADFLESMLAQIDPQAYPFLMEHAGEHQRGSTHSGRQEFAFALDLILDGLQPDG